MALGAPGTDRSAIPDRVSHYAGPARGADPLSDGGRLRPPRDRAPHVSGHGSAAVTVDARKHREPAERLHQRPESHIADEAAGRGALAIRGWWIPGDRVEVRAAVPQQSSVEP